MRKKKYVQKLVVGFFLGMLVCGTFSVQAVAGVSDSTTEMKVANQIVSDTAYSSNLVWMTKTENGIKYKRLYDLKSKKWLTDWIPC